MQLLLLTAPAPACAVSQPRGPCEGDGVAMSHDWPLVGRQRELEFIRRALSEARTAGVLVAGSTGVGRTRLAHEAVATAVTAGAHTEWAHASQSAATIPFGAVAHLLPPPSGSGADRVQLLHQTARHLVSRADGQRAVLCVDDAHLLDDASATLVRQLAATRTAFVVVTAPTGTHVPDPIFALWKDRMVDRLDVRPLNRAEADELLAAALEGQVDGATLHQLWRLTLGRPLFLRELVEGGLDSDYLAQEDGVWRWRGPLTPTPRLVDLIETQMGVLKPGERLLVEMLAFGESVGIEMLTRAGAGRVLASIERRGLLASEKVGRRVEVRLAHPMYAAVVRMQTPARRSREVHRMLADTLTATPSRRAVDRLRIASWRLAAGLPTAPDMLVTAAGRALESKDYRLAERLARAAVERGVGFAAHHRLARALVGLARCQEAETILSGLDPAELTGNERTQLAITRSTNLYWGLGSADQAEQSLRRAAATNLSQRKRDELDTVRAGFLLHSGNCQDGLAAVTGVLQRREADDRALLQALTTATQAMSIGGRNSQAIEAAELGLELEQRVPEVVTTWGHVQLEAGRCGGYALAGRLGEAATLAQEGYQRALAEHWPLGAALFAMWLGHVNRMRGRPRTALSWLRDAASSTEPQAAKPFFQPAILGNLAMAAVMTGDLRLAESAQAAAEKSLSASSHMFETLPAIARAWVAAERGETSRATELALAAAELASARGQRQFQVVALHDVVRLDGARTVADQLTEAAAQTEGLLAPVYAAHGKALAAGDGAGLDQVAARFAEIGALLLAAEAAAHASRAHRAAGLLSSAVAADTRARRWAEQCEGARTPALDLPHQPRYLTSREVEIARLAATGLTSRVIAERLVVSVRTVDNVLHGVYTKLGITGRRELAGVIGPSSARPD